MIGSKKYPMLPISLEEVDGNVMFRSDMVCSLFINGFMFCKLIVFGKKKYIMIQEDNSVSILNEINIVIWVVGSVFLNNGSISKINNSFNICSVILVNMCGRTFCLP